MMEKGHTGIGCVLFYFIGNFAISYKAKNAPLWVHNVRGTLVLDGPKRSVDCALARLEDVACDRARRESFASETLCSITGKFYTLIAESSKGCYTKLCCAMKRQQRRKHGNS